MLPVTKQANDMLDAVGIVEPVCRESEKANSDRVEIDFYTYARLDKLMYDCSDLLHEGERQVNEYYKANYRLKGRLTRLWCALGRSGWRQY